MQLCLLQTITFLWVTGNVNRVNFVKILKQKFEIQLTVHLSCDWARCFNQAECVTCLITKHVQERYYRECIDTLYTIANFYAKRAVLITTEGKAFIN